MEKPILATNIDGFLIKHNAFIEPHKAWFDKAIKLTGDKTLEKWKGKKDYFRGVDLAMEKIMPKASSKERTTQAREWYQESVIDYIKSENSKLIYHEVVDSLKKLKQKFTLALITVNTKEYINDILDAAHLTGIYDIIYATPSSEKPDKSKIFQGFTKKYGKPKYYVAARSKEAFEECLRLGTLCIYVSWDEFNPEIAEIANDQAKNPRELEAKLIAA